MPHGPDRAAASPPVLARPAALFPPCAWLRGYQPSWLGGDLVAGIRLAAHAVPVTLAYATLAGFPPQVGVMAAEDSARYAAIASRAAFAVAVLCLVAWTLRLSVLVTLISDSIPVGFKAGAGITIAVTQLPALFGVPDARCGDRHGRARIGAGAASQPFGIAAGRSLTR